MSWNMALASSRVSAESAQMIACSLCDGNGHRCDYCDGTGVLFADELPERTSIINLEMFDAHR